VVPAWIEWQPEACRALALHPSDSSAGLPPLRLYGAHVVRRTPRPLAPPHRRHRAPLCRSHPAGGGNGVFVVIFANCKGKLVTGFRGVKQSCGGYDFWIRAHKRLQRAEKAQASVRESFSSGLWQSSDKKRLPKPLENPYQTHSSSSLSFFLRFLLLSFHFLFFGPLISIVLANK
jgi:hypothetical protein